MILRVLLLVLLAAATPLRAATDIVEVTSPGGITAWLVEEPGIPMLAIDVEFIGGAMLEPDDKLGVTNLMVGLLEEGSADKDAVAFAQAAETLAARMRFSTGRSGISASLTLLTENRAQSLALFADALKRPRFDEDAIERVRAQVLAILRSDETNPGEIARQTFAAAAFGDHPFARNTSGTPETVAALTRADILAAHAGAFSKDRLIVGVVGDVTAEELGPILDTLFGDLPDTGPELPAPAVVTDAKEVTVVPLPGVQSLARFGHSGIARDDPDFIPAFVMAQILGGGGFTNRLNEEVREKRGLTYGVGASLASNRFGSLVLGQLSSANGTIAEALEVVRSEWARMAETGVTAEELEAAKTYLTGAYPLRFDGNGRIAGILVGLQIAELPASYVAGRNALIEALTLDEVNAAAARLLKPESLRVVVVGQPEGLP